MAYMEKDPQSGKWYLADVWHIEDIQDVRPELDKDQALKVLEAMAKNYDASIGINWEYISDISHTLYPVEAE